MYVSRVGDTRLSPGLFSCKAGDTETHGQWSHLKWFQIQASSNRWLLLCVKSSVLVPMFVVLAFHNACLSSGCGGACDFSVSLLRVSLSDGSDSESSSASSPLHHEPPPPLLKTNNNQVNWGLYSARFHRATQNRFHPARKHFTS